jgi:hypothetical protein
MMVSSSSPPPQLPVSSLIFLLSSPSSDPIGNAVVDIKSLQLPPNVPLFLDLPLQDVPHGSLQIEITLQDFH